ncbi:hypothetical protein AHMF7605_00045 [Adhaeribacter arboris]|uniref:Uncharacterized protein n=1 Tax=Adhaeribacter arboris TaxID=2072846 RepID=A0A2T2Y933_9BACT|nr:CsgG/HfaB family protein [Adhaeribacter arboris]PSR52024.1 hypothetical protein AHMF7605_00045 [Adhaeribacter arboris]
MRAASTFLLLIIGLFFIHSLSVNAQSTLIITKKRPAQLDIKAYKQIAIGDIVGPSGAKNEKSLDLTDDLTSKLFNSNTYEIVDRNALAQILSSQKNSEIKTINEGTAAALSKKLSSALLIIGRLQTETIEQKPMSQKQSIVVNGCNYEHWWEATGAVTIQLKIMDVKTGKMLFSKPVSAKTKHESKPACTPTSGFDPESIAKNLIAELATEITKIVIPYEEKVQLTFDTPVITLKNPFKKLGTAINYLKIGEHDKGLEILKAYADDTSLKENLRPKAIFNYGLGLYASEKYTEAQAQFKSALVLTPDNLSYKGMYDLIDKEKAAGKGLVAK